jgi:hypothetical protein
MPAPAKIMDVLFFLIFAHFVGDYALQTDGMAADKKSSLGVLSVHVLIYVINLWIFFAIYSALYQPGLYLQSATIIFLLALYLQHWLQDYLKGSLKNCTKQVYYIDQVIHVAVLYIYRIAIFHG